MIKDLEKWVRDFVQDKLEEKYKEWLMMKQAKPELIDLYKRLNKHSDWILTEIQKLDQKIIDQLYNEGYITDKCGIKTKLRHIIRAFIDPKIEQLGRRR